jgi:hypothetical protein
MQFGQKLLGLLLLLLLLGTIQLREFVASDHPSDSGAPLRRIRRKTNSAQKALRQKALAKQELVLFPFDRHAFPFSTGVGLELVSYRANCGNTQIVLPTGTQTEPDHHSVVFYGSVVRAVDTRLMMYYIGLDEGAYHGRLCVAFSDDGEHWIKPELGLANYKAANNQSSRKNNLLSFEGTWDGGPVFSVMVLREEEGEELRASRRFKMIFKGKGQSRKQQGVREGGQEMHVAYSADGLRWHVDESAVLPLNIDMGGLVRYKGAYFLSGHLDQRHGARKMHVYMSYDFARWSSAGAVGFTRSGTNPEVYDSERGNTGEQVPTRFMHLT